ncbi:hypothetical protein B7494_g6867 [Chlorociboria aeruginascens]|nr:hypothetical protein B7494_g6867 [Chlorociboria aeruginascens]
MYHFHKYVAHIFSSKILHADGMKLVVVGDQSSGKSSVLEGLTDLPFPRDSSLCTRFPTQIVFKRSKVTMIEVSIMAAHGQAKSTIEAIAKFEPTSGQTTKEDMTLVRDMVGRFLCNPRSIILAVVPANVDIATQEIIQMAEDADPNGERTLGVLTKPDLVDRGAEEKVDSDFLLNERATLTLRKILELVTNQTGRGRFQLGYTIVRNRSQSELGITHEERNLREAEFFKSQPWNAVPKQRAGVKALKARLDKLLIDVTRRSFQAVALDVRHKIHELEGELDGLGPARETSNDQRNHLIRIASKFQGLVVKAIDAYYGRDQCFEDDENFRLATNVMEMNQEFSETISCRGFTRSFRNSDHAGTEQDGQSETFPSPESGLTSEHPLPSSDINNSGTFQEYPELRALLLQSENAPGKAQTDIMDWITKRYNRSKGFEIGTLNPSLLPSLFSEQSQRWEYYAKCHVKEVIRKIHQFNYKALRYCCKDSIISDRIWAMLCQLLLPSYEEALNQVSFLVNVEQSGNLMTLNHYFADNLRKAREDRIKRQLINLQSWRSPDPQKEPLLRLRDTIAVLVSNENHTIQDLHDTLEAYYKVARKRFVDAICLQAVDHFLISSKSGPLWLFSPQFVGGMSNLELTQIAGESDGAALRRSRLVDEIANLKAGERIMNS